MSLTARLILGYAQALRADGKSENATAWEHNARVLAASLIGA